jgi:hypothetical protein
LTDQLVHRLADRGVERFLVELRPVHLLEQIGRDLARTEARHPRLRSDLAASPSIRAAMSLAWIVTV